MLETVVILQSYILCKTATVCSKCKYIMSCNISANKVSYYGWHDQGYNPSKGFGNLLFTIILWNSSAAQPAYYPLSTRGPLSRVKTYNEDDLVSRSKMVELCPYAPYTY